ncbi:MAG TPA: cupin domain-containing protein [Methylovirgula sp.]|jgi:predicted cupin superfamily sugar epimerase|nr:cupin domain-containing protein [Methylovirgula sp.]
MTKLPDLQKIIARLNLEPHPEGGFYRETFRDVPGPDGRARSTLIYFLLAAGQTSAWHRVDAVEVWHFYLGAPLRLSTWIEGGAVETIILGPDLAAGQHPQYVVPAHYWQMAESLAAEPADWTLVGCGVAPGFTFSGFEMAPPSWQPH